MEVNALEKNALKTKETFRDDFYHNAESHVKKFVEDSVEGADSSEFYWINTRLTERIDPLADGYEGVVNYRLINNIQRINKFFEKANRNLKMGQYFVVCMETKDSRRTRLLQKYPKFISRPYYALDFVLKRVFPKWKPTKKLYFYITKGRNRVLSLTEGLGRLNSCGFDIVDYKRFGYKTYIIAQKTGEPVYDMEPTYGVLVRLSRIGKGGKRFDVLKIRTMHPYSEYLQDFAFSKNKLQEGGKIKDDFRVTGWGRIFRKLWIDELPMLLNWLKGEMKLVGVRPLSSHYFSLYPKDVQELRTSVKPGLVPPFYADLPNTLDEIVESERRYLLSYLEKPIRTDIRYFFKAFYNIFVKRARSC